MEKIIVHTIHISKQREKHIFQIALPENTEAITGLGSTTDATKVVSYGGWDKIERASGTLQLYAADTGEHLFSDDPRVHIDPPQNQMFDDIFPFRKLWAYKTKFGLLDTWQPVHTTIIDGYYKDFLGAITEVMNYNIRIYIRLKLR